ncbi:glycosyl hydrolase [Maribacter sp. CXY002]|uniref:glycosyl hydrolase n=1 Tax=Maribacter luteocoastalis TaxID=3407671 RepID=UPI003B679192
MKFENIFWTTLFLFGLFASCEEKSETQETSLNAEELLQNFQNPPNEAKPRVWWHWMNGNVTKNGIRKDLEWMHRTGIGGFQNFDANLFTPVVVEKKLVFMEPDWKDAFKFTTDLADSLKLEMAIAGSPGWSVTGGPWVEPKDGMKKYVWSELVIEGGKTFEGKLPAPPTATGAFQNVGPEEGISMNAAPRELPEYYNDAAVVAFQLNEAPTTLDDLRPKVTSSAGKFQLADLSDGDLHHGSFLPPSSIGEDMWIQYEFNTTQTFSAYTVTGAYHNALEQFNGSPDNRALLVSDDGKNFKKVTDIPGTLVPQTTGSFPETTAKYWRFAIKTLPPAPSGIAAMFGAPTPTEPDGIEVAEFNLFATPRIPLYEQKAGFAAWREKLLTVEQNPTVGVAPKNVIDLTDKMDDDGNLQWEVPQGNWKIIRLGYSLTGRENHPASPEATGLEVDKLDADAVRKYINTYLDMYKDATDGRMGAEGLGYIILDSYEAGHMNWTHNMSPEFQKRRGYDMTPWIPVLTGHIIGNSEQSEKFLWDFRKTIGEMIADNHYDVIGEELYKRGMKRYTESHEGGRIYLADGMDVKRNADIPMSAMWTPGSLAGGNDEEVRSEADIREAASVANIYGKPYVAAESMTAIQNAFSWHPEKLKRTADLELASGLNRYVIHTSVHQPLDDKMPGFSLGPFGQYFGRQETWSGAGAKAWVDYLARSSYLLQQGQNVADILYLYGENDNVTLISTESLPNIPQGHEFDFTSATILKEAISAEAGKLKAKSGVTYEMLQLDKGTHRMTMSTLQKLKELADAGVKIKGTKPIGTPSLTDDIEAFKVLADEIWNKSNVGENIALGVPKDVEITGTDHKILFRHRASGNSHIYWLNNRSIDPTEAKIAFRVTGKQPKKWNPQTGEISEVGYAIENGKTLIQLPFTSWDAFFILFLDDTSANSLSLPESNMETLATVEGSWQVNFQENRGAPASTTFENLQSWTEREEEGIKHFSGTATYLNTFSISEKEEGNTYHINLGEVKNIAEVILNGVNVGTVWKVPFELDVTDAIKTGENTLEIKVTNTWVNRLIGDAQKKPEEKITFTTMPFYRGNEDLLTSGLMGPVKLIEQRKQ